MIILSGAAVGGGIQGTNRTWPTDVISVGGGLNNGLTYILDGGTHNDPYGNLNLPLPFPDALQEFKVETSAVPAQYGQHSAGAMSAVTKSENTAFVPTAQMLAGDWTTVASPACNQAGRSRFAVHLWKIDPALFSTPALNLIKRSPSSPDPCGKVLFGRKSGSDDTMTVGRIDYLQSDKHSVFGRYELARLDAPSDYDGKTWFSLGQGDYPPRSLPCTGRHVFDQFKHGEFLSGNAAAHDQ